MIQTFSPFPILLGGLASPASPVTQKSSSVATALANAIGWIITYS